MAYKVLIPQDIAKAGKDYLLERGYEIKMGAGITEDALIEDVADCDAIIARTALYTREIMKAGKRLKIISRYGVGYENIDINAAAELGIYVTITALATANAVAEHTIGLIIASARNMVRCDREYRNGNFEIRNQLNGYDLEGKVLGLIGVGKIGAAVAKKAALGLGMKVIGYVQHIAPDRVIPYTELVEDWEYIFKNSDFVSLHVPVTEKTQGFVGKKEFDMMKPTAYLINTSRGQVLNERDLIQALKQKKIAGAALDVFKKEPPDKDNELFGLDNTILTPHNASLTMETAARAGLHAAMEVERVLSGKKPSWPVNNPKLIYNLG